MRAAYSLADRFKNFKSKHAHIYKGLLSNLPDEFELDYIIYNASSSILEEEQIKQLPIEQVIKRMMLNKFEKWVEENANDEIAKKK